MSFHLYTGNKLERLAELFQEKIYRVPKGTVPADWLVPELVVTQTKGVADWLKLELAKDSISVNLHFSFVNKFIEAVLSFCDKPAESVKKDFTGGVLYHLNNRNRNFNRLNREDMTWDIFRLLKEPGRWPAAEQYFTVNGSYDDLRCFQLSEKLAELYDQYQIYHGEQLDKWKQGDTAGWHGALYRELAAGQKSVVDYFREFAEKAETLPETGERITVFGVSAMPESYFSFFLALSRICEVHFFYLDPSDDLWESNLTKRQAKHLAERLHDSSIREQGNPLLSSLGIQGKNFNRLIASLPDTEEIDKTYDFEFEEFPDDCMLHRLQNHILSNDIGKDCNEKCKTDPEDKSIVIHNCHTPLREVEVLHDQLLDLLSRNGSVQPRNIIVMAPDIAGYEPYIRAVFGSGDLKNHYALCDRAIRDVNQTAAAFLKILSFSRSMFKVTEVFELLEYSCLKVRQVLSDSALEKIRDCIQKTGIRWGIDGEHRKDVCGVSFPEYSWKQGLDRLLLGYAVLQDEDMQLESDILSCDAVEGGGAVELGEFIRFVKQLFQVREILRGEHSLAEWCGDPAVPGSGLIPGVLDTFFQTMDYSFSQGRQAVGSAVSELALRAKMQGGCRISFDLLQYLLESRLGGLDASQPFLRGKITFCSLMPMRSIPMDVVAILGLNDGEFPRKNFTSEFNVVPKDKTKIDRSPVLEDRFMFLESILAARKNLLLFYQGRSGKDNGLRPPAVPLGEVMEYIRSAFCGSAVENLEVKHKLQAFDPEYFYEDRQGLFSFSQQNREAAKRLKNYTPDHEELPESIRLRRELESMSLPSCPVPEELELSRLENFFLSPQTVFLRHNADLATEKNTEAELADEEPVEPDSLESWCLRQELADWILSGRKAEEQYQIMRKTSRLPAGSGGYEYFHRLEQELDFLTPEIRDAVRTAEMTHLRAEILPGCVVTADLPLTGGNTFYYWRAAKFNAKDAIRWYLRFLLLAACRPDAVSKAYCMHEQTERKALGGISGEEAERRLAELLELYLQGHSRPLKFFPETSFSYAVTGKLVKTSFYDSFRNLGDYTKKPVSMLFHPSDFDDDEFKEEFSMLANTVFREFCKADEVET